MFYLQLVLIWYIRMLKTFQKSLDEDAGTLYEKFKQIHERLKKKVNEIKIPRIKFLINLEIISVYLHYRRVYIVEELIKNLKEEFSIVMIEEGVLGKRTKWQEKAISQFYIQIDHKEPFESSTITHSDHRLPELLKLEDDTRLEMIKFLDESKNEIQEFSSAIQNFILLLIRYKELSQPKDKLSDEEIRPLIMLLLQQSHGPYIIRIDALITNIKFEASHKRTVDRSLRQCEDLVNLINKDEDSNQRFSYFFSSLMTPRYKVEEQLADIMISLGLVKGALDVYLKIRQWEQVIACYNRLDLRHKAAEIIQQELEKNPTVKLYCLLGDATDDIKWYEKAWEFSKERSGLAQRHLGLYYFVRHEYEKSISHLQKSLEINSLQENLWLRLGYAALSLEKYELASSAYIRYTQLEPNGFESWNNLAKCFIKLGNKQRAHKVLQEALKCNYDNWKIWENFLLVSVDVGSFDDALNAYNRLIELKEKYFDEEVLAILIKAIANNLTDVEGNSSKRLRKKAIEMLAHLGSIHTNEGVIWELSALLTTEPLKRAEKLIRAYKGFVSKSPDWTKSEEESLKILKILRDACTYSLQAAENFNESEKMLVYSQLASARMPAMSCIKVVTKNEWESCREIVSETEPIIEMIQNKLKELKP